MDNLHKIQADKLKRAYGEIIELKAEVALLKKHVGFTVPKQSDFKPYDTCNCTRNKEGYQLKPDGKYHCNQCEKVLK